VGATRKKRIFSFKDLAKQRTGVRHSTSGKKETNEGGVFSTKKGTSEKPRRGNSHPHTPEKEKKKKKRGLPSSKKTLYQPRGIDLGKGVKERHREEAFLERKTPNRSRKRQDKKKPTTRSELGEDSGIRKKIPRAKGI